MEHLRAFYILRTSLGLLLKSAEIYTQVISPPTPPPPSLLIKKIKKKSQKDVNIFYDYNKELSSNY